MRHHPGLPLGRVLEVPALVTRHEHGEKVVSPLLAGPERCGRRCVSGLLSSLSLFRALTCGGGGGHSCRWRLSDQGGQGREGVRMRQGEIVALFACAPRFLVRRRAPTEPKKRSERGKSGPWERGQTSSLRGLQVHTPATALPSSDTRHAVDQGAWLFSGRCLEELGSRAGAGVGAQMGRNFAERAPCGRRRTPSLPLRPSALPVSLIRALHSRPRRWRLPDSGTGPGRRGGRAGRVHTAGRRGVGGGERGAAPDFVRAA
jgi:hypothetical protein